MKIFIFCMIYIVLYCLFAIVNELLGNILGFKAGIVLMFFLSYFSTKKICAWIDGESASKKREKKPAPAWLGTVKLRIKSMFSNKKAMIVLLWVAGLMFFELLASCLFAFAFFMEFSDSAELYMDLFWERLSILWVSVFKIIFVFVAAINLVRSSIRTVQRLLEEDKEDGNFWAWAYIISTILGIIFLKDVL